MRRILYTIPNFVTAGSGRAMLNVIERLDRNEFEPWVCVLKHGGAVEGELEHRRIPLLELPFTVPALPYTRLPLRAWQAAKAFRRFRFDLWHSFHYLDDYTEPLIARLAGAKAWIYTKKNMSWNARSWKIRTLLASGVAAQNRTMMAQFFRGAAFRKRARYIPCCVDTEEFRPDIPKRLQLRDCLGAATGPVIGCVAHLVPVKGHPTLLRALARVPDAHLWLAGREGEAPYMRELEGLCNDLGIRSRVRFLGNIADVPALLRELDIFVLPTWNKWRMEGCPVALLEAMAAGLPCIATSIPGPDDVIEHGSNGLLVSPQDDVALAAAIREVISMPPELRAAMGQAARNRILAAYAIEYEVARYERLYRELS